MPPASAPLIRLPPNKSSAAVGRRLKGGAAARFRRERQINGDLGVWPDTSITA